MQISTYNIALTKLLSITQNEFLVEEGATPADIDQVMEDFGFPLGPFKVLDMTGLFA